MARVERAGQPFAIEMKRLEGVPGTVVTCRGDLDAHTFDRLDEALHQALDEGAKYLIVDLAQVKYVSSAGLGILIGAHNEAEGAGGGLVIIHVNGPVHEIFKTTGFDQLFSMAASEEEALQRMGVAIPPK